MLLSFIKLGDLFDYIHAKQVHKCWMCIWMLKMLISVLSTSWISDRFLVNLLHCPSKVTSWRTFLQPGHIKLHAFTLFSLLPLHAWAICIRKQIHTGCEIRIRCDTARHAAIVIANVHRWFVSRACAFFYLPTGHVWKQRYQSHPSDKILRLRPYNLINFQFFKQLFNFRPCRTAMQPDNPKVRYLTNKTNKWCPIMNIHARECMRWCQAADRRVAGRAQSWALAVFFYFFTNKKWYFWHFYKVNLTEGRLFK